MTGDAPVARAAGFGKALTRLAREAAAAPAGRLHVATCHLPPPVDLLRLWDVGPPGRFAAFWEDDREAMAGIGEAARGPAPEFGSGAATPRWFGSVPFAPDWTDEDWSPLTESGFVLPRWTLRRAAAGDESEGVKVTLAVRGPLQREDLRKIGDEFEEIAGHVVGQTADDELPPPSPRSVAASVPEGRAPPDARFARAVWTEAVETALTEIEDGRLEKVVLARRVAEALPPGLKAVDVLRRLRAEGSGRFRFGLREQRRAFVGATPECLFRKRGSLLAVEALAGTYDLAKLEDSDGSDEDLVRAAEHLFASGKDLGEHALVVQGVVDSLGPLAASVSPDEWPQVRGARRLAHLSTTVRAHLNPGVTTLQLVDALHPTPAVGGLPRAAALDFIRRTEPTPRGLFAAPVGWISPDGNACLAVGIRSALILDSHAWVYAGAGIVAASDPESEWEETAAKLRWFRELLGEACGQ